MLQTLSNVVLAFQQHTLLAFLIAVVLFVAAIGAFSGGNVGSVLDGMFRLLASIFIAPFHFLRGVVQALLRFRADDAKEAASRTFLLWRSVQYALFIAFVVSMVAFSAGVTISLLGLWPSEQLALRKELKTNLLAVDSALTADSVALAALMGSNPAQAAQQRTTRIAQLQQRVQELQPLVSSIADSLNTINSATKLFLAEVSIKDLDLPNKALILAQTDSFTERHAKDYSADELDQLRRYVRFRIDGLEIAAERGLLENAQSPADQQRIREDAVKNDKERQASIKQALGNIDYLSGIRFFFTTLLLTYLYLVAFVWAVGTAIESIALFVGLSRDLAAVRNAVTGKDEDKGS